MRIVIHCFGDVPFDVLKELAADLTIFDANLEIGGMLPLPQEAFDGKRRQYLADALLAVVRSQEGDRALGVAPCDLYAERLNFVFGEADVGGHGAVISIARLGDSDPRVFRERIVKEAVHELGHTFGLGHCSKSTCVMHFSNSLTDTDIKSKFFCKKCEAGIPTVWRPRRRSLGSC